MPVRPLRYQIDRGRDVLFERLSLYTFSYVPLSVETVKNTVSTLERNKVETRERSHSKVSQLCCFWGENLVKQEKSCNFALFLREYIV